MFCQRGAAVGPRARSPGPSREPGRQQAGKRLSLQRSPRRHTVWAQRPLSLPSAGLLPLLSQLAPVTSPDLLAQILALKNASGLSAVLRKVQNHHNRAGHDLLSKGALQVLDAGGQVVTNLGLQ